jgi:hypothetical protein
MSRNPKARKSDPRRDYAASAALCALIQLPKEAQDNEIRFMGAGDDISKREKLCKAAVSYADLLIEYLK